MVKGNMNITSKDLIKEALDEQAKKFEQERTEIRAQYEQYKNSEPVSAQNIIEKMFTDNQVKPLDQLLFEVEHQKLKEVSKFIEASPHEKTEISKGERKALPLLQLLSVNPYSISQKIKHNPDNKYHIKPKKDNKNVYEVACLKIFLARYFEDGISVNRKGREEIVKILEGFTKQAGIEQAIVKEKQNPLLK